ncbi:MAG: UDP-N-acetylmuramoyl-tripeptide--D-alanyl-D-alanine ligase [Bacteroidaceae bacterium]|nr:UDP-N-acetylmuramoyl-tripeptide--D-alanyl-D-alanine ligase [Bacteroidaceae bacterium]
MDHFTIKYAIVATLFFLMIAKYDIHMFQLASYRNSRYFRWLIPGNIISIKRLFAMAMLVGAFIPGYYGFGFAVGVTAVAWFHCFGEKFKTPLVYTMRVKRLFATNIILFIAITTLSILLAGKWAMTIIGVAIVLSNLIMLLANLVNTPIEKAINRHYYNDAKRIIESNKNLIVIGVTGSFGKTSTKNYLAGVLAEKYNVLVTPGNFNTLLGVIRTIREHLRPYHQVFIVEMGAKQTNDIKEICDLVHPTIGIVTAVGEMHLETFKTVENIQNTKFELINSLPTNGLGVINNDSQYINSYNGITSKCKLIRYAVESEGDYKANNVKYGANGVSFTLNGAEQFNSRLLGVGNLLNILAATAVADYLGVPVNKQKNAIARLQPVEHRLSMKISNGITVLDDAYNSNPQGAKMALGVLKGFAVAQGNKRIVITPGFVEMGTRQADANKELGRTIANSCDYAIVVNATNRDAIKSGIEEGGLAQDKYFLADSLNHAHAHLAQILRPGDVVLYENDLPDNFK